MILVSSHPSSTVPLSRVARNEGGREDGRGDRRTMGARFVRVSHVPALAYSFVPRGTPASLNQSAHMMKKSIRLFWREPFSISMAGWLDAGVGVVRFPRVREERKREFINKTTSDLRPPSSSSSSSNQTSLCVVRSFNHPKEGGSESSPLDESSLKEL